LTAFAGTAIFFFMKRKTLTFRLNNEWYTWLHAYCTTRHRSLQQQFELMLEALKAQERRQMVDAEEAVKRLDTAIAQYTNDGDMHSFATIRRDLDIVLNSHSHELIDKYCDYAYEIDMYIQNN
jgi:hypothetical protein